MDISLLPFGILSLFNQQETNIIMKFRNLSRYLYSVKSFSRYVCAMPKYLA